MLFISSCDPLVTTFDDIEDAVLYQSNLLKEYPAKKTIRITANRKFGIAYPIVTIELDIISNLVPSFIAFLIPKGIEIK